MDGFFVLRMHKTNTTIHTHVSMLVYQQWLVCGHRHQEVPNTALYITPYGGGKMKFTLSQLQKEILVSDEQMPDILMICGPCRSGTTALSNSFTVAGIESHMQPIKSVLREQADNVSTLPTQIVFSSTTLVLVKETFGAKESVELYNPVQYLIEAGYPASKIKVIGMVREPIAAYDSWMRLWGLVHDEIFESAYRLMMSIWHYCDSHDVIYLPYVPEAIARNDAEVVLQAVVEQLGYSTVGEEMTHWNNRPKFGDSDDRLQHLHFYDSPPERFIHGVREWGGYVYRDTTKCRDHPIASVTQDVYHAHREVCEKKLSISV
jgi:hypothetical protein